MDALNLTTALRGLVSEQIAEVHTSIPARVVGVDHAAKTVTLEAIVKNSRSSEDETDYPTFYDVPFMVNGGGKGRISMPIESGDIGTVLFSERDPSNALQTNGEQATTTTLKIACGLYPICFIPKIATATDSTEPVDPTKVVISNNRQTYGEFSPDGNISIYNTQGIRIDVTPTSIQITDGSGVLTMTQGNLTYKGGTINLNGLIINPEGRMTDSKGVSLHNHKHPVRNVESGNSTVISEIPEGG